MRCYAGGRTVTTLPDADQGPQLEAIASRPLHLVECGVFNTTTTAFAVALGRYTAGGTAGTAITPTAEDDTYTPVALTQGVNSTAATITGTPDAAFVTASIGAAVGAGVIWTFGKDGLRVAGTADSGFILYIPTGTGQHFDYYWVWEE